MPTPLSSELLTALATFDTCSIADAIERTDVRLRNEGFSTSNELCCRFPELPSMLGYAVTLRVRSRNPPWQGGRYPEQWEWLDSLKSLPAPHVLVIEDTDRQAGTGAFVGETHAAIFQAIGCVGIVTNGSVRSLPEIERRRLPLFSSTVSPSHAYIHIVETGGPVEIAGLRISPGQLLHGDRHGLIRIPQAIAPELPRIAEAILGKKRRLMEFCDSAAFSPAGLRELISAEDSSL